MSRELAQEDMVSRFIPGEASDQEVSKTRFFQLPLNLSKSSLDMTLWLQSRECICRAARIRHAPPAPTLESRGECREPIGRAIEDPRLQGLIKSRGNEQSQSQHDQSEPLLAEFAGVQQPAAHLIQAGARQ